MDRRLPDPWEDKCPKAADLLPRDLQWLMESADYVDFLSAWERNFCASIWKQLAYGRTLSLKQEEILDRDLIRKVWRGDERLWSEPLPPTPLAQVHPYPPSLRTRYRAQRVMVERAQFLRMDELAEQLIEARDWMLYVMNPPEYETHHPPF